MTETITIESPDGTRERLNELANMLGTTKRDTGGMMILYALDVRQQEFCEFFINEEQERQLTAFEEAAEKATRVQEGDPDPDLPEDDYSDMSPEQLENETMDDIDSLGEE